MKPESVIFDIDGTLWDSREVVARGYNRYLCRIGHPELQVDTARLTGLFGKTLTEIADAMLPCYPVPQRYEVMHQCMECEQAVMHADPCQIAYPGVVEGLKALARNYRLFLVSNAEKGYPELLMEKLAIGDLFEGHLCYGDTGVHKGETLRILMDRWQVGPCVYVGDTQGDLDACRHAGIPFVFCRYGFGRPESFDASIGQFSELEKVLENL